MDSTLPSAQNALPDILGLIFDRIEYGKKLKNEWEKLDHRRAVDNTKSLLSIAQVCRSWRAAALPYFYQSAEMLLMPVSDEIRYYPEMDYPELSMAAAAGHSQLVRSVYLFLSLDHIVDGMSTTMLKAGALSAAIFPNVTELVIYFNRSNVFIQGKQSEEVGSFIERIRQMFPNAQDSSFVINPGVWADYGGICQNLMGIIAPTPRTFLFRGLADEGTEIQGEFGTGIQRMYLEMYQIPACQLAYSNRDTIKELVLRLTPDADDEISLGDISEDLESLFNCIYPKLTSLSIETGQDVVGCFSLPDINPFPSLTSLSLSTYCDFDIGIFVGDASDSLTSLTIYLTEPIVRSLRGHAFPNLICIRIRKTDITIGFYDIDDVIEAVHLPFLIAPNAEYIEAYCHSLRYRQSSQSFIPQNYSNPQLRHLIISQATVTLSVLQQVLAHFPRLIRIGVDGIQSDEGVYLNTSDNEVSRLLMELPILSTSLRRIDFITSWTVDSLMVVAIAKLPSLRMVTIRAASEMLGEFKEEIGKSVYDEYRDSLSRPLLSRNPIW